MFILTRGREYGGKVAPYGPRAEKSLETRPQRSYQDTTVFAAPTLPGAVGRNPPSRPTAGRKAQTW